MRWLWILRFRLALHADNVIPADHFTSHASYFICKHRRPTYYFGGGHYAEVKYLGMLSRLSIFTHHGLQMCSIELEAAVEEKNKVLTEH